MLQNFRTDPAYLNRYYRCVIALLLAACALLAVIRLPAATTYLWYLPAIVLTIIPRFPVIAAGFVYALAVSLGPLGASFSLGYLLLVPASLILALLATSYIHNAAHDNIRPRWLRRPIGELCALFHLVGFPDWTIVHFIHHRHADDPQLDPHPPAGLSYWRFMNGVKDSIFRVLSRRYFDQFGDDPAAARNWKLLPLHALITQLAKTHFWFLLLGGQVFTFLFLTSIIAKNLHYAFFNYVTHIPSPEEPARMMIVNRTRGVFRVINALSHNLYLHDNHHRNPNLFDPGKLAVAPAQERVADPAPAAVAARTGAYASRRASGL